MATIFQIRGLLLEEAIAAALRQGGLIPVGAGPASLPGRGGRHQVGVLTDFAVGTPFLAPARLVIEAKCFTPGVRVGLSVVREAAETLRDLQAHLAWPVEGVPPVAGHRYGYAVFSVTPFTAEAERYAFAQDVSVLSCGRSAFFTPVVSAIQALDHRDFEAGTNETVKADLRLLRAMVRRAMAGEGDGFKAYPTRARGRLKAVVSAAAGTGPSTIALASGSLPIFLTAAPSAPGQWADVPERLRVTVVPNGTGGWLMADASGGEPLFSFDLAEDYASFFFRAGLVGGEPWRAILAAGGRGEAVPGGFRRVSFDLEAGWVASLGL
ncbi:MAG TPA: hypothetical protein VGL40_14085 [Bacillota bacterium]|jgi:hypothetical protein